MADESFKERYKPSFDSSYVIRLFRLPDKDEGVEKFSFEVMSRSGGFVIYKLPETLWMAKIDQLDWCRDSNILFFTVLGSQKAFIYDIIFMTQVSCDLKPNDSIRWDEENKAWRIFESQVAIMNSAHQLNFGTNYYLKLPYPSDASQPNIKMIPMPNSRYVLVLNKLKKAKYIEPDMWKMGIVDMGRLLWVVEEFPYHVMGEETVRFRKDHYLECYGLNPHRTSCYLFRFNCDDIPEQGKLKVFVNDFSPMYPEKVVWEEENQCWRAVIKGVVIHPRPFYFDNMYFEELPVVSRPVPLDVMERLPVSEKQQSQVEALRQEKKRQMEEEFARNNTSGKEILSRMGNKPKRVRHRKLFNPRRRHPSSKVRNKGFIDSKLALVLAIVLLVAMVATFIAYVASGNHVGPVVARNLFTAIALVVVFLVVTIRSRLSDKYGIDYVLPSIQRMAMGYSSPFVFIGLMIVFMNAFEHYSMAFHWVLMIAGFIVGWALCVLGIINRRKAKTQKQYNLGCWMQWSSIWVIMSHILSLLEIINR